MKRPIIIVTVIFAGVIPLYMLFVVQKDRALYKTVREDFSRRYPDYEFIECDIIESDTGGTQVHVQFRKPAADSVYKEVWNY